MSDAVIAYLSGNLPVAVTAATPLPVTTGSGGLAAEVQGNSPSGVADVGNPVKVGGKYDATLPTFADGQRGDLQIGTRGSLNVTLMQKDGIAGGFSLNAGQDSLGNSTPGLLSYSPLMVFNNISWDSLRGSAAEGAIVKPFAFTSKTWQNTQHLTAAGTTTIIAAAGAGIRNFLVGLQLTWPPTTAAGTLTILDGATVIFQADYDSGGAGTASVELNVNFAIPLKSSANAALNVNVTSAGPLNFNAQGYQAAA